MQQPLCLDLQSDDALREILAGSSRLGVDTEFMRERTYFAQLCLLQISTSDTICCLDPLTSDGSGSVENSYQSLLQIPWVLHSGRQDIEVVWQSSGMMPTALFDTQIAAGLLGYQPQMGYAGLVKELFDVDLAKSQTRADWSRRPLSDDMLLYAAEDVEYLLPAADLLTERLNELGRLDWALQDSADLLNPELYDTDPTRAVGRLKGARNLRGEAFSIARNLAVWREQEALARDKPRQWIVKDAVLLEIAANQPQSLDALLATPGLAERTARRAAESFLEAVAQGQSEESDYRPPARPDEAQKALLKTLQQRVSNTAKELGLTAEIVAPKKELSAAISGDQSGRVFGGWRRELIGEHLLGLINN